MSTYSDQIDVVLKERLIPKMQSVSNDMATVEQYSYGSSQLLSLKRQSDYYSMIYDFLEEYLVGSEEIANDKLVNVVRLLESPDSERKGMDQLGTIQPKKPKVTSGYTMYINGVEVGPETDITPGSAITIIIVYGSSRVITGSKSLEITSGTLDQTTDGFTIILQNMVIPVSLDGTFLDINAQAKENGIALDGGNLFRIPIGNVQNLTGVITLVTTLTGLFTLSLAGTGTATINWGDGSPIETVNFPSVTATHMYATAGGTITITSNFELISIQAEYNHITSVIIPKEFNKLRYINFLGNDIATFVTHKEWVELSSLHLQQNNLSVIDTYAEWTEITSLLLEANPVSVINTFATWTKLFALDVSRTNISVLNTFNTWAQLVLLQVGSSNLTNLNTFVEWVNLEFLSIATEPGITNIDTYAEWVNIQQININHCSLTSLNTFNTWTKLISLILDSNNITSINTFPEWITLQSLSIVNNQLTAINTYPEWIQLFVLDLSNNPLLYFNAYKEWATIHDVYAANCELTNINDVLIQLDSSPIGTGGQINLSGGTNMGPFGLGLNALTNLGTKGLTQLLTNTEQFMSDIQGNQYAYRTIGSQVWTVENLKTTTYNDGTPIPNATLDAEWTIQDGTINASDWFLPSEIEMNDMKTQLYQHGVGGFTGGIYLTSYEIGSNGAMGWNFTGDGGGTYCPKGDLLPVRPARSYITVGSFPPIRSIGQAGGFIFATIDNLNGTWTNFEAAPSDLPGTYAWSNITSVAVGTTLQALGAGKQNTLDIIAQPEHITSAALQCTNLVTTGNGDGAYCWYNNNIVNKDIFGAMYNWYAVVNAHGIAPTGWHVPTDAEWQILATYLGGDIIAGGELKEMGRWRWTLANVGATNESRFTEAPAGSRGGSNGTFFPGNFQLTWAQDLISIGNGGVEVVNAFDPTSFNAGTDLRSGLPVRLVKD